MLFRSKAVDYVLAQAGYGEIRILGASAGRLDHVVGHLALVRKYHNRARILLEDGHGRACLVRDKARLDDPPGTLVSFFALGAPADGLTTQNLRYALRDRTLELGVQDSISNVIEATPAWVRVRRGEILLLVITSP